MSYYTCAPLALAILPAGAVWYAFVSAAPGWPGIVLAWAVILAGVLVVVWWLNMVSLAHRTMPHITGRAVMLKVGAPLIWLALAGLILVVLPLVLVGLLIVITSLR